MTTEQPKRTPCPWEVTPTLGKLAITRPHKKIGIAFDSICHMDSNVEDGIHPGANADFIVQAVNSFDLLLEAVNAAISDPPPVCLRPKVVELLCKAKRKAEGRD